MPLRERRAGDQQYPVGNDHPHTHDLAANAMADRKKLGISRYGQPLQPVNGRDFVRDAWEEAMDVAAYMAGVRWEQDNPEHTYVGRLVRAAVAGEKLDFTGVFVPEPVRDLITLLAKDDAA